MSDILYLVIGATAGLAVGAILVYMLPYRALRHAHVRTQNELAEQEAKTHELQGVMLEEQSRTYQNRQSLLTRQKRAEDELNELRQQYAALERQYNDLKAQSEQHQQVSQRDIAQFREAFTRLEQEKVALQDRFARDSMRWDQERQGMQMRIGQLEEQAASLQQDKIGLNARLEQHQENWERERLAMQIQMNTLEDNLTLQKARAGHTLPPDSARLVEQLRKEATDDLTRQQRIWDEERQALQAQVERLQAERQSLLKQAAAAGGEEALSTGMGASGAVELMELRQQLEQLRQEKRAIEERLNAREQQSGQERSALEAEIEQLMERLMRLQRERSL